MAQVINERYARVRQALIGRSTSDLIQLPVLWRRLDECLPLHPGLENPRSSWQAVASSDAAPGIIDLLDQTIDCDKTGLASSFAVRCVTACVGYALPFLNEKPPGAALVLFNKVVISIASIMQKWWKKFRRSVPRWIQEKSLPKNLGLFIVLFGFCGEYGSGSPEVQTHLEQAVVLSVELHDFLLFAAIFFNVFNEDFEAALVFALSAATRTRHQPNRLARMSTLREQLKVHPLALSSRLKELLRGCKRDPRKAFHVVLRTIAWLSEDAEDVFCVNLLSQADMASELASAYWLYCVSGPGGREAGETAQWTLALMELILAYGSGQAHASRRAQSVGRLILEYDLLSVVEKVMVIHNTTQLLLCHKDALRRPLRRDFLPMLDYLRAVETPKGRRQVEWWLRLGSAAGVHEGELRDELDRQRKAGQGGLVGCSWVRCAMYEQDSAQDTFMCSNCRKAMYCGPSCQDRDWREGGHAEKCQTTQGTP